MTLHASNSAMRILAAAFAFWLSAAVASGQGPIELRKRPASPEPSIRAPDIRVDSNLVLVPVTVCDASNHPITGLEKQNFRVFDDGVEQTITHFSMDDEPVAVGLIFDVSGSMGNTLINSRRAAAAFFGTVNREDEFFLILFQSSPKLVMPLTRSAAQILNALTFTKSSGQTALVDAVILGLHELKKSKLSRRALLVISDGEENNSRYSDSEMRNIIRESDALIYGIGGEYLRGMAELSGGHGFIGFHDLQDVAWRIGIELRNRYVLGFSPTNAQRDGRRHRIEVRVISPPGLSKLTAHWRRGYDAPD